MQNKIEHQSAYYDNTLIQGQRILFQVYRGHTPHFCNFVHQAHLHSKQLKETTDSTGIPDSELGDDLDYIESFEGRLVGKYRKGSNSRYALKIIFLMN